MIITLKPRMSEKTFTLSQGLNTYVFDVPLSAGKTEIKRAVEKQFKVAVTNVNVARKPGKIKQSNRKRSQPVKGQESAIKKAFVTLKKGDKIAMFEEG